MAKGNSVQKKIRDLERARRRKDENDPAVKKLDQMINDLKQEKSKNEIKTKEKKHAQKYHMVKFFERRKITRSIHKLEKRIAKKLKGSGDSCEELNRQKEMLEQDLAYVMYYPKTMKYVSLFVDSNASGSGPNKSELRQKKARKLALDAWRNSVDNGEEDKVAHAMDVERKGGNEPNNENKYSTNSERMGKTDSEAEFEPDDSEAGDSDSESESDRDDQSKSSSSSGSESGAVSDVATKTYSNSNEKSSATSSIVSAPAPPDFEPDPFFLEEDDGTGSNAFESSHDRGTQWFKGSQKTTRAPRFKGNPRGKAQTFQGEGTKALTKQQARLLKWQTKQSEKKQSNSDRSNFSERSSKKRPLEKLDTRRPKPHNRNLRMSMPKQDNRSRSTSKSTPHQYSDSKGKPSAPKAAWEEGGGVSAKLATPLTQSRVSGTILTDAKQANKKIKFDE